MVVWWCLTSNGWASNDDSFPWLPAFFLCDFKETLMNVGGGVVVWSWRRWCTVRWARWWWCQWHGVLTFAAWWWGWRIDGLAHMDGQRLHFVEIVDAMAQMWHDAFAQTDINFWCAGQYAGHFIGGLCETGTEPIGFDDRAGGQTLLTLQFMQMTNGQLEDVGLFQFRDIFTFGLQCGHH